MRNFRIYPMIILASLLLAIFFPKYFQDFFAGSVNREVVFYSPVDEDFIKMTINRNKKEVFYSNMDGSKIYPIDVHKSKLPFIFLSDVMKIDKFPPKLAAFANNPSVIRREKSYLRIKPDMINTNIVKLFPLFESKPKYSSLDLPKDLFRLDEDAMTFVISETGKIDKIKSELYTNALKKEGASFPLKDAFGTASTMKPFDEGYFLLDSKNKVFHVKQIEKEAFVKKVDTKDLKTKFILNKESKRKEYYGALLTEDNEIYLIMYGGYELVKLPVENYDYNKSSFKMMTTPINRIITINSVDFEKQVKNIETIVTNLDYEVLKKNKYSYSIKRNESYELAKSWIIPYKIQILKDKNGFYNFEIRDISKKAIMVYSLLALCLLIYVKLSKRDLKDHIPQVILISFGGIYSIIVLLLFNKLLALKPLNIKEGQK